MNRWLHGSPPLDGDVLGGDSGATNLLVTAPAGRGKTALLVRWISQLTSGYQVVFLPISIRFQTNQAHTFYQAFAARLADILGEALAEPRADPTIYYRDKVIEYFGRLVQEPDKRCLIVIDGLDEARGWKADTTVLPFGNPTNLKIVISARELAGDRGARDWLARIGWTPPHNSARTLRVEPLSRDGVADVLGKMAFPVAALSRDIDVVDELYRLTEGGDPLLLELYAYDLLKSGQKTERLTPADLRTLEPGFAPFFEAWLDDQRTEWRAAGDPIDDDLVDAILAVLAAAFGPLSLRDLEELVEQILPETRMFSARRLEPLRRFIVGDGFDNGYVISHPKLGDYLSEEYFRGSSVLRQCRQAFIAWLLRVVEDLNSGVRATQDASPYALLFLTQHVAELPAEQALPTYRAIIDDGWRRAWEHFEGGTGGFGRDVELAARALGAAAAQDPDQLRSPLIGLGGLVRCALVLSSIRSIGAGLPGTLLAEFLRSASISPRQALHLWQLKSGADRVDGLEQFITLLPSELRSEAYASAREIPDPSTRFRVLMRIADKLTEQERDRAALDALRAAQGMSETFFKLRAVRDLERLLPPDIWLAAKAEIEQEQAAAAHQDEFQGDDAPGRASETDDEDWSAFFAIRREAGQPDLSDARKREILLTYRGRRSQFIAGVVESLAPNLDEQLAPLAMDVLLSASDDLFRGQAIAAIIPNMPETMVEDVAREAIQELYFRSEDVLNAAFAVLRPELQRPLLDDILAIQGWKRGNVLSAISAQLSPQLKAVAFDVAARDPNAGVDVLIALVPYLEASSLEDAMHLAVQIGAIEQRGQLLSILWPRIREANILAGMEDAYRVAFLIGDVPAQTLAIASLARHLSPEAPGLTPDELRDRVERLSGSPGDVDARVLALILLSRQLPDDQAASTRDVALTLARALPGGDKAFTMALAAASGPASARDEAMTQAIELARVESLKDHGESLAVVAALQRRREGLALLDEARRAAGSQADGSTMDTVNIVGALFATGSIDERLESISDLVDDTGDERALYLALKIILAPDADTNEVQGWIDETIAALPDMADEGTEVMIMAAMSLYASGSRLNSCLSELLAIGSRANRASLLFALAIANGLLTQIVPEDSQLYMQFVGSQFSGSPFERLGDPTTLTETAEAIRDVTHWWP